MVVHATAAILTKDRFDAMRFQPLAACAVATVLALAACGSGSGVTSGPDLEALAGTEPTEVTTTSNPPAAAGVLPQGTSALDDMRAEDFPAPLVDPGDIRSGGPPPDGITPIDDPRFLLVMDALERFDSDEAVVVLEINGDARAYPVQVMILHEIVNDTVGGVPVSVTYCPLCNSAVTYRREIRGVETTFGTSGRLYNSALVMYDRATESLWTHYDGRAVVGVLAGEQLEFVPSPLMSWSQYRSEFPGGRVLDPEQINLGRSYGTNPYVGYDDPDSFPFLFTGDLDDREQAMTRVVGISLGDAAKAFTLESVSGGEAKATNAAVGDLDVVVFWAAGQASAVESREIAGGRDVGTVGVFGRAIDGRVLTFQTDGDQFVDDQTGTIWRLTGEAETGPLAGKHLVRLNHLDTFWFAWSSYHPTSELVPAAS
jgi:hypothetical protein